LKHPRPEIFGILVLPFGAAVGFTQIAAPWWLAHAGVDLAQIGAVVATSGLPHGLKIFWCPLIDLGPHRKLWYVLATLATALMLGASAMLPDPGQHVALLTILLTVSQVAAATSSAALDALMAICARDEDKGRAGGWYMAGNIGGTGILGAGTVWLGDHFSPQIAGTITALAVMAAAIPSFWLIEPRDKVQTQKLLDALRKRVVDIARDLWITMRTREGITGIVILLSPVGCGALTNLFSALAPSYNAPAETVELVNGLGGGITGALGSILGGYLADRMNRRVAYAIAGGITACCALAMMAGPLTPMTFALGSLSYSFANGIAFACFAGMVLEMVSHGAAVATKYALFTAVSNLAINYMTALDGWAGSRRGVRGSLAFDAVATFAGIGILALMVVVSRGGKSVGAQTN
jgi:PAT family beta-lactamase induction signal transducer AmpG